MRGLSPEAVTDQPEALSQAATPCADALQMVLAFAPRFAAPAS